MKKYGGIEMDFGGFENGLFKKIPFHIGDGKDQTVIAEQRLTELESRSRVKLALK
ncbi:MAG TPA: hypothetical protein VIR29_06345 [Anseongella sp.]